MREQSQTHSVSGGGRRERIYHRATLFVFPSLPLALFFHCPGKGTVCSCAQQSNSCAMGTCAPGAQWARLPSENSSLLLPGICSSRLWFQWAQRAPTREASQWQSGPEAGNECRFPTHWSTLASNVSSLPSSGTRQPWVSSAGAKPVGVLTGHPSSQHLWRGFSLSRF